MLLLTRVGLVGLPKAIEIKRDLRRDFYNLWNGKQVRDVLHADDVVNLYFKVSENIEHTKGKVFNVGGGIKNIPY